MVGFEVTPTTASSRIIRSSSPRRSMSRDRKSIQTLCPWAESVCRRDSVMSCSFHLFDLLQPPYVTLSSVESCPQEGEHELACELDAEIDGLVAGGANRVGDSRLQLDPAVVERDRHLHGRYVTRDMTEADRWRELGQQLRVDSIRASAVTKSGHPTSSMSAADLMAVLLAKYLRYDFDRPEHPGNDHLVFSKGHASPLLYALFKAAGAISDEELLGFRELGSRLEGHPTPVLPWVDVATGSLGQGLPVAGGIALAGKRLDRLPYRVWALCGDSEMAEGSMWEAFEHAAHEGLDNLTAIIDVNRLGQTTETMVGWDLDTYVRRAEAFGWKA